MPIIDIYLAADEQRPKRRRGKWLIPLVVGLGAALALGRETSPAPASPKPVVAPPPVLAQPPAVVVESQPPPVAVALPPVETLSAPPPVPGRMAVTPARLDFGQGPLTRGVPAQMATIRNEGGQPLVHVSASVDESFMATSGCPENLAPGDQCMIAIVFTPKQSGRFAGSLKIAAGEQRAQVPLRGSVPFEVATPPVHVPSRAAPPVAPLPVPAPAPPLPPPASMLCFEPARLVFTSTGNQTITLTNPEPVPLRVVAILPIGRQGQTVSGYEVESRRCLRVLNAGEQCKFTVRASDLALRTQETMQLTVYYDDPVTGSRRPARFSSDCSH